MRAPSWLVMLKPLLRTLFRIGFGRRPDVRIWHPEWLDYRMLSQLLKTCRGKRIAYVRRAPGTLDESLGACARLELASIGRAIDLSSTSGIAPQDLVLVEVQRSDFRQIRSILDALYPQLAADGRIAIFLKERSSLEDGEDLSEQIVRHIEYIAPRDLSRVEFSFAGGHEKRMAWAVLHDWFDVYSRRGVAALPSVVVGVLRALWRVREVNLREMPAQDARISRSHLSSFLMIVKR